MTRGGAHFTPPSLARSVVDQTLQQFTNLQSRTALTLLDPACGSGAFLHEAVRGLERAGFGRLTIVGMDISSPAAAMARFVMARAQSDWSPAGGMTWEIRIGDSLQPGTMPEADMIIMNPPFVAVGSLDKDQQDHIDRILGKLRKGRPDLSMAFILEALQKLRPGGALGCLFPASLLELEAASLWRKAIAERSAIRFLALLGDHGLFAYALIQVGAAVFQRAEGKPSDPVLTLWTADEKEVTGEALRALRTIVRKGPPAAEDREKWRVTWASKASVDEASSWRLRTPQTERLIENVRDAVGTVVEDIFDVRQGILTGSNEAFILTREEWAALPAREQSLFKPALMNKSVEHGRFTPLRYVFYPYQDGALLLKTEEELTSRAPTYAQRLQGLKAALRNREGFHDQWWSLTRRREWMDRAEPRVISKYFGGPGAFVPDMAGEIAVVQGYAWYPTQRLRDAYARSGPTTVSATALQAYGALLNTRVFARLLANFAPRVAGGQFNLSRRYVRSVPLPDLAQLMTGPLADEVLKLESLGQAIATQDTKWMLAADAAAAKMFRIPMEYWK